MGCMAGNIAAASMDVPTELVTFAYEKLPLELREILDRWYSHVESIEKNN
jgi:hypothetical protein